MPSGEFSQRAAQLRQFLPSFAAGFAWARHHLDLTLQHLAGQTFLEKRLRGPIELVRHRGANMRVLKSTTKYSSSTANIGGHGWGAAGENEAEVRPLRRTPHSPEISAGRGRVGAELGGLLAVIRAKSCSFIVGGPARAKKSISLRKETPWSRRHKDHRRPLD